MFGFVTLALKRLRGNKDYTQEVENIMKEKTAMQNVCSYSLLEFIRDKSVRWQLLTIITTFVGMQMCGINAVSYVPCIMSVAQKQCT